VLPDSGLTQFRSNGYDAGTLPLLEDLHA